MTDARPCSLPRRLSALMVNYESGAYALTCLRSVQREWAALGGVQGALEVIVVENASPHDQSTWIELLEQEGARVVVQDHNSGYAAGIELAFRLSRGSDDDHVLILNPDVVFLPGSLGELLRDLEDHPEAGALAPRCFVDEHRTLLLPPVRRPRALAELGACLARACRPLARGLSYLQRRRARRCWTAEGPLALDALAGACVLMPRRVAASLDCLLDGGYPLYYEDVDLCQRLLGRGFELRLVPHAHVLHHWSRSAGAGADFEGEPRRRWEQARELYFRRWFSAPARASLAALQCLVRRLPTRWLDRPLHASQELGAGPDPIQIELPGEGAWLLELSLDPCFSLCAGVVTAGERWSFPPAAWDWLFAGRYQLRASHLAGGRVVSAWTFEKTRPARCQALQLPPLATPAGGSDGLAGQPRLAEEVAVLAPMRTT